MLWSVLRGCKGLKLMKKESQEGDRLNKSHSPGKWPLKWCECMFVCMYVCVVLVESDM